MNKTKVKPVPVATHTAGPWRVSQEDQRGVYADGGGVLVATLHTIGLPEQEGVPRMEITVANARLVAAAPELLEALKRCVSTLRNCNIGGSSLFASPVVCDAVSAIANAEGK